MGKNTATYTYDTFTDLRLTTGDTSSSVTVLGASTINDGNGGRFYYDATSTATDDGLNIIQPTPITGAGRWIRSTPLVTKANVGLSNVDNTPDISKPVSTLQQEAINDSLEEGKDYTDTVALTKADQTALVAHTSSTSNPHSVTKSQVGLGNVDNTADLSKPVSTAQQTAIDAAVGNVAAGVQNAFATTNPSTYPTMSAFRAASGATTYTNFLSAASTPIVVSSTDLGISGGIESNEVFFYKKPDGFWEKKIKKIADTSQFATKAEFNIVERKTSELNFNEDADFSVTDEEGFASLILKDGKLKVPKTEVSVSQVGAFTDVVSNNSRFEFSITDEQGFVKFGVKNGKLVGLDSFDKSKVGYYPADIVHIVSYGQSLSLGSGSRPAISTVQKFSNLMFVAGVRFWDSETITDPTAAVASLVPLVEINRVTGGSNGGETPVTGWSDMVMQRIQDNYGIKYDEQQFQLLGTAPGNGGAPYSALKKGTFPYSRLLGGVTAGLQRANELNKTYSAPMVAWTQGENDYTTTDRALIKNNMLELVTDLNTDIKSITKQYDDVILCLYQPASNNNYGGAHYPNVALAYLEAALTIPKVYMSTPMYIFSYNTDNVHLTAASSKWYGAYIGLVYEKVILKKEDHKPVYPKKIVSQNNIIEITFNVPSPPLVFDTTMVTNPGNFGFNVLRGATQITINSVTMTRTNTVKIVLAQNIISGDKLTYAINGTGTGTVNGTRGNLRDSQGDEITFDIEGISKPMHNWCPIFEKIF